MLDKKHKDKKIPVINVKKLLDAKKVESKTLTNNKNEVPGASDDGPVVGY